MGATSQQRQYRDPDDQAAIALLNELLASDISADEYRSVMYRIGAHLGTVLLPTLDKSKSYCLAITVEDADFLAAGLADFLKDSGYQFYLACFWNDRKTIEGRDFAPILNTYFDQGYESADEIIILKAIMAGACVVKTNITALIEKLKPQAIHVVAPVMHVESRAKLELEFPESIYRLFDYTYLAMDAVYDQSKHEVIPGVGGNVYRKLGFAGDAEKNAYMPETVRERVFA
ncbi:MAG: hypothetical protein R3208_19645 [Ketobacteraceae bacterium]|nr:hypothetical protein [Ketobacteraceae bacterium]